MAIYTESLIGSFCDATDAPNYNICTSVDTHARGEDTGEFTPTPRTTIASLKDALIAM